MTNSRRKARIVIFQSLYESDITSHSLLESFENISKNEKLSEKNEAFCSSIIEGITKHQNNIYEIIQNKASRFPVEQIAKVDVAILKLAVYEILFQKDKEPAEVIINEAIEIAKAYGSNSSGAFINGVLAGIFNEEKIT